MITQAYCSVSRIQGARQHSSPPATETTLWLAAILFFGVGDVVTTVAGLHSSGVSELSPLLSRFGAPSVYVVILLLKAVVFGVCYLLWQVTSRPHCIGAPLGLAVLGIVVTCWNSIVLTSATL